MIYFSLASYSGWYEVNHSQTAVQWLRKHTTSCITGFAPYIHNAILQRVNLCPFLLSPMHRSYYTVPPTWPPLSPTLHPVCSQPHQVSRLAAPEVTASVLYSSVNDASFHACYNLHYQSLCHCRNFQSILLIFLVSQSHEGWLHETSFSLAKILPSVRTQLCIIFSCMHFRIPLA